MPLCCWGGVRPLKIVRQSGCDRAGVSPTSIYPLITLVPLLPLIFHALWRGKVGWVISLWMGHPWIHLLSWFANSIETYVLGGLYEERKFWSMEPSILIVHEFVCFWIEHMWLWKLLGHMDVFCHIVWPAWFVLCCVFIYGEVCFAKKMMLNKFWSDLPTPWSEHCERGHVGQEASKDQNDKKDSDSNKKEAWHSGGCCLCCTLSTVSN